MSVIFNGTYFVCSFFQLKGEVDDCSCKVDTVDSFNNLKIYPRVKSLVEKDYFRYWKVGSISLTCRTEYYLHIWELTLILSGGLVLFFGRLINLMLFANTCGISS